MDPLVLEHQPLIRSFRLLLCALALALGATLSFAQAPTPVSASAQKLDGVRASIEQIEQALGKRELSDAALLELRANIEPLNTTLKSTLEDLTPKLDAAREQLEQLGPKPADKAPPEAPAVAAERERLQKQFEEADAAVKRAKLLSVRLDQASGTILSLRRDIFTRTLLARSSSILSPSLWTSIWRETPADLRALGIISSAWWSAAATRLEGWGMLGFLAGTLAIALGYGAALKLQRRVVRRDPAKLEISTFTKARGAIWVVASTAVTPLVAIALLIGLWRGLGLFNMRLEPLVASLWDGVARVAITLAIARGLLAPGLPHWRLLDLSDRTVERLARLALTVAIFVSAAKVMEAVIEVIGAGLALSVALRGLSGLVVAGMLAMGLQGIAQLSDEEDACLGPKLAPKRDWYGPMRLTIWACIAAIILATLIGYVSFAAFLVEQVVWVTFIGCGLYLLLTLARESIGQGLQPQARVGRAIMVSLGLRRESLEQWSVLLAGAAQLGLITAAVMLALAPWGVESDDMFSSIRAAFFGFKVGDVTISLSGIIVSVLLFAIGFALTRGFQHWLESTLLPRTQLDAGLRNSIRTSVGYIGFVIAAAVGLGYMGLSFDKLAIVAGALSVGIGFGLQSIVNNFVSGLILLWERAIRVGDWVVLGEEQGYVRRINVRSTEIETFDRATMIVPNSNLVTGVVKNWVRGDKTGRIKIPISVHMSADPEVVRDTLIACARAQDLVLGAPAPFVSFVGMTETLLKFELMCFVADVETSGRVKSDLHFDIFKRFKAAGIEFTPPAAAPPTIAIAGLERLEAALGALPKAKS